MPQVSILMPIYNCEPYVAQTLDSMLAQTLGDFELIAVDDGSTDGSKRVLDAYAKKDRRLRVVSRANTGMAGALNEGLAMATAPWIARIDADDLSTPDRLERQVRHMIEHPEVVCLGCCADLIDKDGRRIGAYDVPLTHEQIDALLLRGHSAIHHPAVMMRADALRRVKGYREMEGANLIADYDLWLRLAEIGRLANLPDRLIVKRQLETGIVCTTLDKRRRLSQRCLNDAWARRGLAGEPPTVEPDEILTLADVYAQWAWMALGLGEVAVARRYARRALVRQPWKIKHWRMLACACRGR